MSLITKIQQRLGMPLNPEWTHLLFAEALSKISSVEEWLFLRKGNRDKRLMYDKLHKKWTENQKHQILWSDDFKYALFSFKNPGELFLKTT